MPYRAIPITRAYLTLAARRKLDMRCNATDCPAPTWGMCIGDTIITKQSHNTNRARVYHPFCAVRKRITYIQ